MGKVMQPIKLRNSNDVAQAGQGERPTESIRSIEITALVDTGATMLVLPADVVAALGVPTQGVRRVRYASGEVAERTWVGNIEMEILGRKAICSAIVEKAGTTALMPSRAACTTRAACKDRRRAGGVKSEPRRATYRA